MKKPTKDELITEVSQLKVIVDKLERDDEKLRTALSISLGAGTYKKTHYDDSEQIVYSWYAIFREIGKLLERKKDADLNDAVQEAHRRLSDLQERVSFLEDPKR